MTKIRMMTVSYATDGSVNKPQIRIANWFLHRAGFSVKDKILVEYRNEGVVIIRKSFTTHEHFQMARPASIGIHPAQSGLMVPSIPGAVEVGPSESRHAKPND